MKISKKPPNQTTTVGNLNKYLQVQHNSWELGFGTKLTAALPIISCYSYQLISELKFSHLKNDILS